ncbi:c-type cytochrome [Helicobacter fennelliae]|uniref:Ubiquinol cytochrome C oxidoreductase, cytochrome C1 subunit n=2 Tax=Helicobacter fennelliae TaxID=215 RepID=T1DWX6_9HELI|nr:c-type cytochrome [Helicobacter fennelliae]GAD20013.1 ubiquinol cytochrome C oxidoreductase, cytochrome C1 subunit [Helicobacter fennelliae MRY12-0050]SQB98199.1 ubiquinol cytochrome c oxidoreductase, cytochrome c1 subunit [Helicobacter fennelliae]STP07735.1 ubiquinol cytochrome c oxidoreductase, cytochrome c1 subunit [Helicobacter fennelliae]STQ84581.1 ubiquinol cytochrome c oxidoreductase, cytochrome c1 subunit [Helicobacter fennelliae]
MREFKILVIVAVVVGIIYWGVEPLAHSIMHPKVSAANYDFKEADAEAIEQIKKQIPLAEQKLQAAKEAKDDKEIKQAQKKLDKLQNNLAQLEAFWNDIDFSQGNAQEGKAIIMEQCLTCHNVASQGLTRITGQSDEEVAAAYGVLPPDLSNIASVLDRNYLAHFIKNPILASKLWEKDDFNHAMPPYMHFSDKELADVVVYLESIAPKELSDKEAFEQSCARCHSVNYDSVPALSNPSDVERYLGKKAPDLSMMIRSRGADYLEKFINDPQKLLANTSMPRVGATQKAEKQIIAYLESVGDSKKAERESLGFKIIIFFVVMSILAYLWKRKIWNDLH